MGKLFTTMTWQPQLSWLPCAPCSAATATTWHTHDTGLQRCELLARPDYCRRWLWYAAMTTAAKGSVSLLQVGRPVPLAWRWAPFYGKVSL